MTEDPARIGRFIVESAIGRGAMGVVYRAHDPEIDRAVAIKLVRADLLDGEEREVFLARFRREAQAAARCAHPNIVAVYDFALHEGNPFLAMEFVDGQPLSQVRAKGAVMRPAEAVYVAAQVLDWLGAAHQAGIVHRDIKPANIMLARTGQVKVADFGISRLDTSSLTGDGMMIGTPSYMSPEQCRGAPVDARSDLFSVGVVLFELLSGVRPFSGENAAQTYAKLLHEEAPDLGALRPELPGAVVGAVARALAKAPDGRFGSAAEMAAALRRAVGGGGAEDLTVVAQGPARGGAGPGTGMGFGAGTGSGTGSGTGAGFDREVMNTLERRLAEHVGPIARYLVQSAARQASSVEGLCAALASKIEEPAERSRFEQDVRGVGGTLRTGMVGRLVLSAAELEGLQTALARHVGPVARVLIKRALPGAESAVGLWRAVAVHIEDAKARAAFLREGPG